MVDGNGAFLGASMFEGNFKAWLLACCFPLTRCGGFVLFLIKEPSASRGLSTTNPSYAQVSSRPGVVETPALFNSEEVQQMRASIAPQLYIPLLFASPSSFGAKAGQHMLACAVSKGLLDFAEAGKAGTK